MAECTVLVVDDDEEIRETLAELLGEAGYEVTTASGGQEALDELRRSLPHVLVLDLMMPGVNGFDVLHAKEKDPSLASVPVIVISATPDEGVTHVDNVQKRFQKPFALDPFLESVRQLCPH
jgi:CheY-like chemotaxis protein